MGICERLKGTFACNVIVCGIDFSFTADMAVCIEDFI